MEQKIKVFLEYLKQSISNETFIRLTLSKYKGKEDLKNIYIRTVKIKNKLKFSCLYRYKTKDITKNFESKKLIEILEHKIGREFLDATLVDLVKTYQIQFHKDKRVTLSTSKSTNTQKPDLSHNKTKKRFVELSTKYLQLLEITNSSGELRQPMSAKYIQINKFIEVIDHTIKSSTLKEKKNLLVADMGCGKGYLTFALYDFLKDSLDKNPHIEGIDTKEEIIKQNNKIAKELEFSELKFYNSTIENYETKNLDMLIALHACNTATDDAIAKGIKSNAEVIVCSPCCHKELRSKVKVPDSMSSILKYGILLERECEILTDGLRALFLEYFGYKTKVFEFVSSEHTGKNLIIVAIKNRSSIDKEKIVKKVNEIKSMFGLNKIYLEKLLPFE